jgi:hypothetical protein
MKRPTCSTCAYWLRTPNEFGECRRLTPQPGFRPSLGKSLTAADDRWPRTRPDDWCGEHHKFEDWIEEELYEDGGEL